MEEGVTKVISQGSQWEELTRQAPYLVVFLVFVIYVLRYLQRLNVDHKQELQKIGENHARDLGGIIDQSGKREDRLAAAFERNTAIQARVLERLHEPDPEDPRRRA